MENHFEKRTVFSVKANLETPKVTKYLHEFFMHDLIPTYLVQVF